MNAETASFMQVRKKIFKIVLNNEKVKKLFKPMTDILKNKKIIFLDLIIKYEKSSIFIQKGLYKKMK